MVWTIVSKIGEYLGTDWSAMTVNDWIGLTVTVLVSILMVLLYIYVWRPKNRDRLEAHRYIVMNDDSSEKEDRK